MRLDEILIRRNPNNITTFILHAETQGFKFTGEFADMGGFLTAVSEMAQFFAIKTGRMKSKDQQTTRPILNA
jgi:hypothetical protein